MKFPTFGKHLGGDGLSLFSDDAKTFCPLQSPEGHHAVTNLSAKFGHFVLRFLACFP
jgi:hypothetical protein